MTRARNIASSSSLTILNGTLTGTLTAGGSTGTSGYVLSSTGTGVQWIPLGTSSANPGGVVFGNSLGNYTSTTAGISGQLLMSYGNISNGGPQFVSIAAVVPVVVATTANLTGTYANNTPGTTASTFTITATGTLTIDGYLTVLGDRILLKNQNTALQNGIYTVTTAGATGVSAVLTRDNDSDTINKITGVPVSIGLGTTNGGTQWVNANKITDTLGTTSIVYNQSLNSASTTSSLTSFGTNATLTTPTIDIINAASATSTSAALFSNITTGTIAISANSSSAAATLNILTGATTSGTKTINIGTNGATGSTTTINIGTTTGTTPTITLNGTVNTASGSFKVGNTTLAQGVTGTITFPATAGTLMLNPMTTAGDIIYGGASGAPTRLAGSATNNFVLTYNTGTSAPVWAAVSAIPYTPSTLVSSNITLVAFNGYFIDTTAARTLTLPAAATLGDEIHIFDVTGTAATNNITVSNNGLNIRGSAQTLVINVNYAAVVLVYLGATYGWRVS
jgi:hypothetical protein